MKRNKIRVLAIMMALCLCLMTACSGGTGGSAEALDVSSYQETSYTQVDSLSGGAKVAVTGTTDYNTNFTDENGNYFRLSGDGDWYVALGATTVSQVEKAISSQKVTVYGVYAGKTSSGQPVVNIQTGGVAYNGKVVKTMSLVSGGQTTGVTVWIPTNGGTKYHSKSTCSGMKDPMRVDLSVARANGYTACKKCY